MYQPQSPDLQETSPHGTQSFPCAFYQTQMTGCGVMVKHHWHKEIEILYFPGGNFSLEINMETFDISSECFYFINPGELHSIRTLTRDNQPEYAVVFHPELLCAPFYDSIQSELIQPLQNGQLVFPRCITPAHPSFSCVKTIFLNLTDAFMNCSSPEIFETSNKNFKLNSFRASGTATITLTDQILIKASLLEIFSVLTKYQLFSPTEKSGNRQVETIKATITYIREHYQEKIYVRDLASLIGLNEQYFCRFFKKAIGMSPVEYINEYRIRQAIRLLENTDKSVTEICLDCGYNNMGNFLKEFRKYIGTTPLQYRKAASMS